MNYKVTLKKNNVEVAHVDFECVECDQTNADSLIEAVDQVVLAYPELKRTISENYDEFDFGITEEVWTHGEFELSIEPGVIPGW